MVIACAVVPTLAGVGEFGENLTKICQIHSEIAGHVQSVINEMTNTK